MIFKSATKEKKMKIEKRKIGNVTVFDLKGKILFGDGIDELRQSINSAIKDKETQLVLNFAEVPYLDSTGLGEVVRSYTTLKKEGGTVKIANLTNKVKDLMMVTKLITVFETFENENEAVKSFK
jgi:anti-sigma B factor antagonist